MTPGSPTRARPARTAAVIVLSGCLVLPGCTAVRDVTDSLGFSTAQYDDPADACSVHRRPLIQSKQDFAKPVLIGAGAGAIAGALLGGVLGGTREALLGALGGALAGAAGGYLQAKYKQGQTKEEALAAIDQDIGTSQAELGEIGRSFQALNRCRSSQIAQVRSDVAAERVSDATAGAELARIRGFLSTDRRLFAEIFGEIDKANAVYVDAVAKTREVDELVVAGEAASYEPVVVEAAPRAARAKAPSEPRPLPKIDPSRRPRTDSDVQELILASAETRTEYDAQYNSLEGDLDALEILVQ
jgi:hypothetical protein